MKQPAGYKKAVMFGVLEMMTWITTKKLKVSLKSRADDFQNTTSTSLESIGQLRDMANAMSLQRFVQERARV